MKKIFAIAALAAAQVAVATPVFAQSANDYMRYDQARDPGYQSAVRGGRYYGGYPVPCILCALLARDPHKPSQGELRTLPDGTTFSYDKRSNTWKEVNRPAVQPRSVYTDRDVYVAQ